VASRYHSWLAQNDEGLLCGGVETDFDPVFLAAHLVVAVVDDHPLLVSPKVIFADVERGARRRHFLIKVGGLSIEGMLLGDDSAPAHSTIALLVSLVSIEHGWS